MIQKKLHGIVLRKLFLDNKKAKTKEIVAEMVDNFRALGCNINLKLLFLILTLTTSQLTLGLIAKNKASKKGKCDTKADGTSIL